tara:strand:+ start:7721 stop:7960 length:240 start_codon:yes stop_codon:yes gene_type:complete
MNIKINETPGSLNGLEYTEVWAVHGDKIFSQDIYHVGEGAESLKLLIENSYNKISYTIFSQMSAHERIKIIAQSKEVTQ